MEAAETTRVTVRPKRRIRMTVAWVRSVRGPGHGRIDYSDAEMPGLQLRVSHTGRKSWRMVYRVRGEGKQRVADLGAFPEVGLAEARDEARRIRGLARKREDPFEAERRARGLTFGTLAEEYIRLRAKSLRTAVETEREIRRYLLPAWETRPAVSIERRDVIELCDPVIERGAKVQANRVFELARRIFNFGIQRDLVKANPCALMKPPGGSEPARDRALSADEISTFWRGLEQASMFPWMRTAMRLVLVTAQRPGEVALARWDEIDAKARLWTIPGERAKNRLAHRVPLSGLAVTLIESLHRNSEFLFSSPIVQADGTIRPVERHALSRAIDRARDTPKGKEPGPIAAMVRFTPHDLRRTAASHMARLGVDYITIAKVLNHTLSGVTAIYNRHGYDPEKRRALDKWGRELERIIAGESERKVVDLRRRLRP
jgi:integrase